MKPQMVDQLLQRTTKQLRWKFFTMLHKNMSWVFIRIVLPRRYRIAEAILMNTHNIDFDGEIRKTIPKLSSNTKLSVVFFFKETRRLGVRICRIHHVKIHKLML